MTLIFKVIISSFASVGIIEYLKNFIKSKNTIVYTIIMPFISSGCFCACSLLPLPVIGSILTIGSVQLDYQFIVQGFKKIINKNIKKLEENNDL